MLQQQQYDAEATINSSVLDEISELFREEYRKAWNLPFTREVLSHVSNIMLAGLPDVCPGRLPRSSTVRRLALQVFNEYQLQLVDPFYECTENSELVAALRAELANAVCLPSLSSPPKPAVPLEPFVASQNNSTVSEDYFLQLDVPADSTAAASVPPLPVQTAAVPIAFPELYHLHRYCDFD